MPLNPNHLSIHPSYWCLPEKKKSVIRCSLFKLCCVFLSSELNSQQQTACKQTWPSTYC